MKGAPVATLTLIRICEGYKLLSKLLQGFIHSPCIFINARYVTLSFNHGTSSRVPALPWHGLHVSALVGTHPSIPVLGSEYLASKVKLTLPVPTEVVPLCHMVTCILAILTKALFHLRCERLLLLIYSWTTESSGSYKSWEKVFYN